jgi:6-phosphogluconate dehydrogenase
MLRDTRNGPSLMLGGSFEAYKYIEDIFLKVAAQVPNSGPCVTYIGKGGSDNFVKMVHNGTEYGNMQLIAEDTMFSSRLVSSQTANCSRCSLSGTRVSSLVS